MLFKALYKYNRHFVLIILFCLTECIIDPIGNFPLNDDWWYAKTLQHFLDHKPGFVSWSSSTQVGQTFSAFLFAKLVGSTFTALRFYTLTLSLIGILVFYNLCSTFIFKNGSKALLASLLLMFCPFYISLSNSFMTEIPLIAFLILSLYFYFKYTASNKWLHLLWSLLFLGLAVLTRQVALVFALGIAMAAFMQNRSSKISMGLFILIPFGLLFLFELWLKQHDASSAYPFVFSSNGNYRGAVSFIDLLFNVSKRWVHYVTILGFILSPLLIASMVHSLQNIKTSYYNFKSLLSLALFGIVLISFKNFPIGNYLYDCGFGPDTLYDSYIEGSHHATNSSTILFGVIRVITLLSSFQLMYLIVGFIITLILSIRQKTKSDHFLLVFFISLASYYLFYCYSSALFDRYIFIGCIPLLFILINETSNKIHKPTFMVLIFLLAIFSALSTRDYLSFNRSRWESISELKSNNITDSDINGGYEHEGYCFSDSLDWVAKWHNVHPHKYMIAHGNLKNYKPIRYKICQRFIPFKKDSIYVLERIQ